jgi:outer membrane protein OmpA-like peptidoglycan-associated protein
MAEDWSIDVKKYVPDADDAVIAAIVRYCGIALRTRDASLVAFSDPVETGRVRDNYCRKKLALTDSDEALDAAIAAVGARMAGDPTKNRVTVYYLLAEHFGKLGLFGGGDATVAAAAEVTPLFAAAMAAPSETHRSAGGAIAAGGGKGQYVPILLFLLAAIGLFGIIAKGHPGAAPAAAPAPVAAVAPAVPEGAGVVAADQAGKPMLSVYFDTAKTDVTPDLPAAAAPLLAYLTANPEARLAVSGYNDPRGDAAMNAELSKNRAKAVAAALVTLGVAEARIDLVKPADTTDTTTDYTNARRVDVTVP